MSTTSNMSNHALPSQEREPLLSRPERPSNAPPSLPPSSDLKGAQWLPHFTTISPRYRFISLLGCAIVFINEAEYFTKQVASLRAIESMYCYNHYRALKSPLADLGKHIPERLCKDHAIQKDLARTAGLIMFVRMLSAMLGAIPLGWLADRTGRKTVIVLHKLNLTVSCAGWLALYLLFPRVPIWTFYLTGLPGLIGGNFDIGLAMLFASYTDVIPSATERASLFFLTTSMQYLAQTFCPTIGAFLMDLDGKGGTPEVNLAVSLGLSVFTAVLTIVAFPETVQESRKGNTISEGEGRLAPEGEQVSLDVDDGKFEHKQTWLQRTHANILNSVSGIGIINVLLLASAILFAAIGIKSTDWYALLQYPVIKLHWNFSQSSYVVTLQGFFVLFLFIFALPALNVAAARHFGSSGQGQFAIMAGSSAFLILGSLLMGLSSSSAGFVCGVVVYVLGEGMPTATQAYIVSLIDKTSVARVMATLSMASIGGKLIASVMFPKVLAMGLDSGVAVLVGLPFFVSAGLFGVAAGFLGLVGWRVRREDNGKRTREAEEEG